MSTFYGVYLDDGHVSSVLDLVRFLAEPDSLRTAHITLRGPYENELPASKLDAWNSRFVGDWFVYLDGPSSFFNNKQSTVIIRVQLKGLQKLVKKPDFSESVAHLTLYDGKDKNFAKSLLSILYKYDLYEKIPVTKVMKLGKKAPLAGEFFEIYPGFREKFAVAIGFDKRPGDIARMSPSERLCIIDTLLASCFKKNIDKLLASRATAYSANYCFDFTRR